MAIDTAERPTFGWGVESLPIPRIAFLTLPLAVMAFGVWHATRLAELFGDTAWYATGARALVSTGTLYDPAYFASHPLDAPVFWEQAPSTALFTLPLLLPGGWILWGLAMAACTVTAIAILWPRGAHWGLLGPVLFALPPVAALLMWSNLTALAFLLLAIAVRWPRHAGWAIGIAAAAKVTPILAVAWLIGRRDWRNAALALAIPLALTGVVVLIKGPDTIADFLTVRASQWMPADEPVGARFGIADWGLPDAVAYGAGAAIAILAAWRASFTLAIIAMLAASPALHMHYWTWLLVPLLAYGPQWLTPARLAGRRTVGPAPTWPASDRTR